MLPTERRTQLDGILQKMTSNGESEDAINFVVNDFKNKYSVQEKPQSFLDKTRGVLDMVFGGGKVGEQIGSQKVKSDILGGKIGAEADYSKLTPDAISRLQAKGVPTTAQQQRQETAGQVTAPTGLETAGSALQSAALFIPGGAGAKGLTTLATKAGVKTGASALGKIGAGLLAGEAFDVASNLQQGKTGAEALTPGLGSVIGGAIPAAGVAKNVMVRFGERQAPRIINSLIKPLAKDFAYGKNPGRTIASEGIIANNFDDLLTGIRASRQKIGQEIGNLGDTLSQKPLLNIKSALNPLDEAAKSAASQNNTTLLSRINNVKRALTDVLEPQVDEAGNMAIKSVGSRDLENLTFQQARHILSDVGDLTAFTGNPTDDKLVNGALKKVYGAIKGETLKVADAIDPKAGAEFRKLTEKYADLTSAEVATKYRDKIIERQDLIGLSPRNIGIGTGLITAIATGGATIPAILAGLTGATLDKLASTPAFKTRLAYLLSTKTQNEANYLFRKIPALSKFFNTKSGVLPGDVVLNKAKQALQDTKGVNRQAGFISTGKSDKYLYHGTNEDVLANISKEGLKPMQRGQLSLSKTEDYAKSFAKEGMTPQGKTNSVILRVNQDLLKGKTTLKRLDGKARPVSDQLNEILTKEIIPPEALEIYKNGKWQPLKSNPLIEEAKKYKSAEEFIKSQHQIAEYTPLTEQQTERSIKQLNQVGIPVKSGEDILTLYHGSNAKGIKGINESGSLNPFSYLASDKNASKGFVFGKGGNVLEIKVPVKDAGFVQTSMAGNSGVTIQNPVRLVKGKDGIWRAEKWNSKQELTDIWKQAQSKSNSQAGKLLKSPLMVGAGATLAGTALATPSSVSFQKTPEQIKAESQPVQKVQPKIDYKKEISFRETGNVKKDPYTIVKKNTNGTYDLGKYQINTAALKAYGDDFLGKSTTSKELLASPQLQEKFIEGYIKKMEAEGIKDKNLIIAMWHRGWGNRSKERLSKLLNEDLTKKYLNNKPK